MEPSIRLGGGAVAILLVGIVLGHAASPRTQEHTEYKVIHVTDTKTVAGPTVTVDAPPPEACRTAVQISNRVMSAGQQYERTAADLLDILGEVRQVSVTGSPTAANDITNELNALTPKTIGAANTLGSSSAAYYKAAEACLNSYPRKTS